MKQFRNTNLKRAFATRNTTEEKLFHIRHKADLQGNSGVYQLRCSRCDTEHVVQTGYNF